jgi:DNA-directed RNA polymerase specialized sigma24 family protein
MTMARPNDSLEYLLEKLEPTAPTTQEAYKRCRSKMVKFFQWRGCEDSAALADETIARFVEQHASGTQVDPDKLYSYLYAIALHVFYEFLRKKKKADRIRDKIKELWPARVLGSDKKSECQKHCLERLEGDKEALLGRYYFTNEEPADIADDTGITVGTLRLRIHRIKQELRTCCEDCLKDKT